jgi:hypothetical protein
MFDKIVHIVFETGWFYVFLLAGTSARVVIYYVNHPQEFSYDMTHDDYDPSKDCGGSRLN